MPNSAEVVFLPADNLQAGTIFIVFCAAGYNPKVMYGTMNCNENGLWVNSPQCIKGPTITTAEPIVLNYCTASLTIENSASIVFIPANDIKTGTAFLMFCKYGYGPKMQFGTMKCSSEGLWDNAPICSKSSMYEKTTNILSPSDSETTSRVQTSQIVEHETTTTDFVSSEQEEGKHCFVLKAKIIILKGFFESKN